MYTLLTTVGFVSAVLGIISFLLPINSPRARWSHAAYIVFVSIVTAIAVHQSSKIDRLNDVARGADNLMDSRNSYTHRGYALASLAFLEKNRDLFPDSYNRAVAMCQAYNCASPDGDDVKMVDLAYALHGLLKGIGTLSGERPGSSARPV